MDPYQLPPAGHDSPAKRWLQSALAAVAATGLLVLAFFFALFALAAAAALVVVLGVRWWWIARKTRLAAHQADDVVEGEYRVVERNSGDDNGAPRR